MLCFAFSHNSFVYLCGNNAGLLKLFGKYSSPSIFRRDCVELELLLPVGLFVYCLKYLFFSFAF